MAIPIVYNLRNIVQRPAATMTTAVGVGLTVAVLLAALSLAEGFRATSQSAGSPNKAVILGSGADSEVMSGFPLEAGAILRANPRVATGADGRPLASLEMVATTNLPRVGQKGSSNLRVRGVDLRSVAVRLTPEIVEGRMFAPGSDEVIVGRSIATRFEHCRVGDQIKVARRRLKVVGLFAAAGSAYESEVWGDASVLMPAFHREGGYQVALLQLRNPAELETLKRELEADPRLGVKVEREDRFYAQQAQGVMILITVFGGFITAIMAVGAMFGAANTMFAAVKSRTREVAMLMVLGFSPVAVTTSFVIESVLTALIGGGLGCLLALSINGIRTSTTNFQSFSEVAFRFRITPPILLIGLIVAAALGVIGGLLPAWRASRQPLAAGLRAR